jgi:hypothetical protein
MIKVSDAESYLKDKIGDKTNDVVEVWEIFKSFCREPVEGEDEVALLFQCGVYNFTGEELFYFDFIRQFTVYEDEEYSCTEQLHCEFVFKPTDALKKLEASEWYFDTDGDMKDFFAHVENLKEFKVPLKSTPLQLNIYQEEI